MIKAIEMKCTGQQCISKGENLTQSNILKVVSQITLRHNCCRKNLPCIILNWHWLENLN